MRTYFLWLEPAGKAHELLATTIANLSQEHAGPRFDPHVTLLGDLAGTEAELSHRTRKLAQALPSIDLTLTVPAFQDQYFQCVFMCVEENARLLEAHMLARKVFHKEDVPPYMPHLSLLYGLDARSLKEQIIGTLPASLNLRFTASAVTLLRAGGSNPKDWRKVQTFAFSGTDKQTPESNRFRRKRN
jgi:2'-5' RNA ligase